MLNLEPLDVAAISTAAAAADAAGFVCRQHGDPCGEPLLAEQLLRAAAADVLAAGF